MINMNKKRGKIWLAVAGIVVNSAGEWLVVKKKYGGLKGKWSLPAGFVKSGETLDEAVIREVKEETGIDTAVLGVVGIRTGVIHEEMSDNMVIFLLNALSETIVVQTDELFEAAFLSKEMLKESKDSSILLLHLVQLETFSRLSPHYGINPGNQFGYSQYHLYL
jgi:8-oxo-dGTP diphosphatase